MSGQTLREKRALRLVHTFDERARCAEGQPLTERDHRNAAAHTAAFVAFVVSAIVCALALAALP